MWLPILGLILGILIGLRSPLRLPVAYARYMSVAVLAALDSVFGGLRARMEGKFDTTTFTVGFFSNALLAALLTYLGDRLGVELYYAALFAFGVRIFQNLAMMRRHLLDNLRRGSKEKVAAGETTGRHEERGSLEG